MKKSFGQILVLALVLTFISGVVLANVTNVNISIGITGESGRGVIWDQGVIEAGGMGVAPPRAVSAAQGKALARRAAVIDAQRNLLETTKGVQIDSSSRMEDNMITSDVVSSRVSGIVKGAKIVLEEDRMAIDGSYIVIMQLNMYGSDSLASVVFDASRTAQQPFPQPAPSYRPASFGGYTGLIVDARNLNLKSSFSPRVYDEAGNIIYGNKYIDPDFAISQGMVDYSSLNVALGGSTRVGTKPLVVRAIRVVDNDFNVVISNEDAQKALAANVQSGFMKKCAVAFSRN